MLTTTPLLPLRTFQAIMCMAQFCWDRTENWWWMQPFWGARIYLSRSSLLVMQGNNFCNAPDDSGYLWLSPSSLQVHILRTHVFDAIALAAAQSLTWHTLNGLRTAWRSMREGRGGRLLRNDRSTCTMRSERCTKELDRSLIIQNRYLSFKSLIS